MLSHDKKLKEKKEYLPAKGEEVLEPGYSTAMKLLPELHRQTKPGDGYNNGSRQHYIGDQPLLIYKNSKIIRHMFNNTPKNTKSQARVLTLAMSIFALLFIGLLPISQARAQAIMFPSSDATPDWMFASDDPTFVPVISGLTSAFVDSTTLKVSWTTDVLSTSFIEYGTQTQYQSGKYPFPQYMEDANYVTDHSFTINNLDPDQTYYFEVGSSQYGALESISPVQTITYETPPSLSGTATPNLLSISPSTAAPGDTVTATGDGFSASDCVILTPATTGMFFMPFTKVAYAFTAKSSCIPISSFVNSARIQFVVPANISPGSYNVAIKDNDTGNTSNNATPIVLAVQSNSGAKARVVLDLCNGACSATQSCTAVPNSTPTTYACTDNSGAITGTPGLNGVPLVPCTNTPVNGVISDKDKCDFIALMTLINNVINFIFVAMAIPIAAIMFVYAGFLLVTSGGSTEARGRAKNIFWDAVIGLVVALAAWLIIKTILTILAPSGATSLWSWIGF